MGVQPQELQAPPSQAVEEEWVCSCRRVHPHYHALCHACGQQGPKGSGPRAHHEAPQAERKVPAAWIAPPDNGMWFVRPRSGHTQGICRLFPTSRLARGCFTDATDGLMLTQDVQAQRHTACMTTGTAVLVLAQDVLKCSHSELKAQAEEKFHPSFTRAFLEAGTPYGSNEAAGKTGGDDDSVIAAAAHRGQARLHHIIRQLSGPSGMQNGTEIKHSCTSSGLTG